MTSKWSKLHFDLCNEGQWIDFSYNTCIENLWNYCVSFADLKILILSQPKEMMKFSCILKQVFFKFSFTVPINTADDVAHHSKQLKRVTYHKIKLLSPCFKSSLIVFSLSPLPTNWGLITQLYIWLFRIIWQLLFLVWGQVTIQDLNYTHEEKLYEHIARDSCSKGPNSWVHVGGDHLQVQEYGELL